jgi:hypothetical protein
LFRPQYNPRNCLRPTCMQQIKIAQLADCNSSDPHTMHSHNNT